MGTIILVTVLSTLGLVTIVSSIVILSIKLKNKVDGNTLNEKIKIINDEYSSLHRELCDRFDEMNRRIEHEVSNIYQIMNNENESIKRMIDSRLDKLDSKFSICLDDLRKIQEENISKNLLRD